MSARRLYQVDTTSPSLIVDERMLPFEGRTIFGSSRPLAAAVLVREPHEVGGGVFDEHWRIVRVSRTTSAAREHCDRLRKLGKLATVAPLIEACNACVVHAEHGFDGLCPACAGDCVRAELRAERAADALANAEAAELAERAIACPRCEVGPGVRCTALTHTGYKPLRRSHAERIATFAEPES